MKQRIVKRLIGGQEKYVIQKKGLLWGWNDYQYCMYMAECTAFYDTVKEAEIALDRINNPYEDIVVKIYE